MASDFQMPKLGLTMEEGTILEWLVPDGADVAEATAVLRIETDKVETDVEVTVSGRLHQLAQPGETYACGAVIGIVLAPGETPAAVPARSAGAPAAAPAPVSAAAITPGSTVGAPAGSGVGGRLLISPNARRVAAQLGVDVTSVRGTGPGGRVVSEDVEAFAASPAARRVAAPGPVGSPGTAAFTPSAGPVSGAPATAAARQLADLLGVDLAAVAPDAIDGRVTRDAVAHHVRALLARLAGPAPAAVSSGAAAGADSPAQGDVGVTEPVQEPTRIVRMTGMRGTIAKRMHASLQQMAQLTLTMDAEMDAVVADREARRANGGPMPGYTDYVIAAVARALRAHPAMNAQVAPAGIALLPAIHVGLAVAVPDGLLVPVVRDADRLGLAALAEETSRLANGAREGRLAVADYAGGTFSVTALGTFGVDSFTPVINPPNAGILGVGRLREDVAWADGQVRPVRRLTLSLTWDHRILDGAPAAEFCQSVVAGLAAPASLDD